MDGGVLFFGGGGGIIEGTPKNAWVGFSISLTKIEFLVDGLVIDINSNRVMAFMKQLEKTDRFCEVTYVLGVSMMKVAEKS